MANVMEKIRKAYDIINPRFDATMKMVQEIEKNSTNGTEMVCNGFTYGYMQGMKAAKAEMKR